jgi:hypothetical protein
MAQLLGPDATSRTVTLGNGKSAHGRTATVYSDDAATTLADINVYDGTETPAAAISGSTLTVGADSLLPRFWFEDDLDTLYIRVNGKAGIQTIYADVDARLDAVVGLTAGDAVADQGALTASAPAALTAVAAAGAAPDDDEFDALLADVTALRGTVAAVVVDLAAGRTKLNALLASLRAANLIDT